MLVSSHSYKRPVVVLETSQDNNYNHDYKYHRARRNKFHRLPFQGFNATVFLTSPTMRSDFLPRSTKRKGSERVAGQVNKTVLSKTWLRDGRMKIHKMRHCTSSTFHNPDKNKFW